jgi:hypothetical protein
MHQRFLKAHRTINWRVAAIVGLLIASAGCAPRPTSLTVPLLLIPTGDYSPTALAGHSLKVYVQPIHDSRQATDRIGENHEEPVTVPILSSGPAPADWLRDSLISQLRLSGVNVVTDPSGADRQISANMSQFWVDESPNYHAHLMISLQVQGPAGQVIWSGPAVGEDSTVGHSLSIDNYQQVLSDAVYKLVIGLVSDHGFDQAVTSP